MEPQSGCKLFPQESGLVVNVAILGSTGLVGESLIRVLLGHPEVRVALLGSKHAVGKRIDEELPTLRGSLDLRCEDPTLDRLVEASDVVFLAGKSPEVMALVPPLLAAGKKVIDIGAEFRLKSAKLYEQYYKEKHLCPDMLERAVYGLPELHRDAIRRADLVANPGCYATTAILALAPLLAAGLLVDEPIPVDAYSGLSGAGRTFTGSNLFVNCNENVWGYKLGTHRHTPEIEQELSQAAGRTQRILFLPHVVPLDRGIYMSSFVETRVQMSSAEVLSVMRDTYAGEPFVRVIDDPSQINLQTVRDTNLCDVSIYADPASAKVVVFSALDNMVKGAAGQAIQNMNLLYGFEETLGLKNRKFL
jgi:N-acetyl-gamma-glutamyl-phosphate reductase